MGSASRNVSHYRRSWYVGAVAVAAVVFQFGFGDLLHRLVGGD